MSLNIQKIMENSKDDFALICAGMIHSDNIVDLNEIKYCHRLILKMFGEIISFSDFILIVNNYENDHIKETFKSFYQKNNKLLTKYEKEYLITTLIILGLSDFEITKNEIQFLKDFSKSMRVNPKIVEKLVEKTQVFTEKIKPENII
tara:strand:+ start:787 stop:1227 length:441 start_codon:yes stop_codon:yes gene_type:complete